jgi:hypothetical protein
MYQYVPNVGIKISVNHTYNDEDMIDLICCAVAGGIGYWACIDNTTDDWQRVSASLPSDRTCEDVIWTLLKTGQAVVIEDVEGEDGPWELTIEKLAKGIELTLQNEDWDGDVYNADAYVGDCIVQYGLFGELIYG